nr:MAG TPA: hypothetical protein [Caudoviricetes sp.]
MENNYTVAELKKMLAEAENKERAEKEKVEAERKKKLAEERADRWKEVVEAEKKYHDLYSKFYQDYKVSNGSVADLLDYMLGRF